MPPPASFITISSIPFSRVVTQAEFNVANLIWFKYTNTTPIVLGGQTNKGGSFVARTTIFLSDGTTVLRTITGDLGWWKDLTSTSDYYIRIDNFLDIGGPINFDFTFTVDTKPLDVLNIVAGDIIINDDTANLIGVVLDSTGDVKFYHSAIPPSELAAILPSNISFWHDPFGRYGVNKIAVLAADFTHIASVDCGLTGTAPPIWPAFGVDVTNNKVYTRGGNNNLWSITDTGVATDTGYTFPVGSSPKTIAINENGTKLYWFSPHIGIIHTLNLTTLTDSTDLYTIPGFSSFDWVAVTPNINPGDMFVMPNGNVVTWWRDWNGTINIYRLIVISSSGVLLYTYAYSEPDMLIDHLAYIYNDSDHILVWWFVGIDEDLGKIGRLTLSTGNIDQDFTVELFTHAANIGGTEKFGPSTSCTFVRLTNGGNGNGEPGEPGNPGGGIFTPVTDKRTDSDGVVDVKIPNPTFKTGLLP